MHSETTRFRKKPVVIQAVKWNGATIGVNPSNNAQVDDIKRRAADLIDVLAPIAADRDHPGARCASIAMTEIESAAMWGVKAVTKPQR